MKNDVNIDQLFQKASNAPVHTSFDATKQTFVASLGRPHKADKRSLRLKKWIIMVTIITCASIGLSTLFFEKEVPQKEEVTVKKTVEVPVEAVNAKVEETQRQILVDKAHEVKQAAPKISFLPLPLSPIKSNRSFTPIPVSYYDLAQDRREKYTEIEIPELSDEEMETNEKRKKKMMKALAKRDKNSYVYVPSGSFEYKGRKISVQAFYMQTNEVTNEEFRTFLTDLLIQGRTEDYQKAYPQETQWSVLVDGDVRAMQTRYFTDAAYANYPVVNVTRKGAEMFCKWLTLETSQSKYVENPNMLNDLRLPQRMEWVSAAKAGDSAQRFPCGASTQNEKACYLANYKPDSTNYHNDGAFFTAKTGTYLPNEYGIYNLTGNVAEMVYGTTETNSRSDLFSYDKSFAGTAGGGWMDGIDVLSIEAEDPYFGVTEGHPNIGFRVVMTYLRE